MICMQATHFVFPRFADTTKMDKDLSPQSACIGWKSILEVVTCPPMHLGILRTSGP
jgi:hypothetical protein